MKIEQTLFTIFLSFSLIATPQLSDAQSGTELIIKKANNGNATAQFKLANLYLVGCDEVNQSYDKMFYWYQKAAEQNHAEAQLNLAACYEGGFGIPRNKQKIFYWTEKAARLGNIEAQYKLGTYYYEGIGIEKNLRSASVWFKRAVTSDQSYLKKLNQNIPYISPEGYARNKNIAQQMAYNLLNYATPTDRKEAIFWYIKLAVVLNDDIAQFNLGCIYENGLGAIEDAREAVKWFRKSAEQGYKEAQSALGNCYVSGRGVLKDFSKAVYWWKLAAAKGTQMLNII